MVQHSMMEWQKFLLVQLIEVGNAKVVHIYTQVPSIQYQRNFRLVHIRIKISADPPVMYTPAENHKWFF